MKLLGLSLVVIGLTLATIPATAQGESTSFSLDTHSEGTYFTLTGATAKNPTLTVPANTEITITINAADSEGTHNICVGDACSTGANDGYVTKEGDSRTLTFTSGSSKMEYYCLPHKGTGMKGTIAIAGAAVEEKKDSPGVAVVGIALAMLGAALLVRHRRN